MTYRDVENLQLQKLRSVLATGTGIPISRIWLKKPAEQFIQAVQDGPNISTISRDVSGFIDSYPAIGINYIKDAEFKYNNYGEQINVVNGDGTSTLYSPLGEIHLYLSISLFTSSRSDQRKYGTALYMTLLSNTLLQYDNDVISGEYFRQDLVTQREVPDTMPYHKVFIVRTEGRILQEITNYSADTVQINTGLQDIISGTFPVVSGASGSISGLVDSLSTTMNTTPSFTATSGGVTWLQ
jgi:hypothetical protein